MMFQNDRLLILLVLTPFVAWWIWRFFKQRDISKRKFAEPELWAIIAPIERAWVPMTRMILITLAVLCIFLAAARPKGGEFETETTSSGIDIFLVMDLSKSMMVEDVGTSRIALMKRLAKAIIDTNPHDRIGIIGFTGEPYVICPLTLDHSTLTTFLETLSIDEGAVTPGTAVGDAIGLAIERFQGDYSRAIVLFSDGESNKGTTPGKAARDALREGVRIFAIGIGTEYGARLFDRDFFGRPVPKTYHGEPVVVRLDKDSLKEVASITGGKSYFIESIKDAQDAFVDFDRSSKALFKSGLAKRKKELAGYFLLAAAILLMADFVIDRYRLIPRKRPSKPLFVSNNGIKKKRETATVADEK